MKSYLLFLFAVQLLFNDASFQDVVGCGGFVKSDIPINYSLVEIKLYTKQGILKYQTDCAPHNGYYLIPLYDKGDYVLKVEPPSGWAFEPNSFDLHVDGKTDSCSKGQDINFVFKGFTVEGKVVSSNSKEGPSKVNVLLKEKTTNKIVLQSETKEGGSYRFEAVLPGNYIIEAVHKSWKIVPPFFDVALRDNLLNLQENFVISGYDVKGRVISTEDPIKGVNFILFSKTKLKNKITGCDTSIPNGYIVDKDDVPLCHVVSNTDGSFIFSPLPPGQYKVLPFYKGKNIKFDVMPSMMQFTVKHSDVTLGEVFKVQGFSVSGRVLTKSGGKGVAKANVMVKSESDKTKAAHSTITSNDGVFHLENMNAGMYHIAASDSSGNLIFPPMVAKVTPNTPHLPDVIASGFKVCGQLIIQKTPAKSNPKFSLLVENKGSTGSQNVLTVDQKGAFCSIFKSGSFVLRPVVSGDGSDSIRFDPPQRDLRISDQGKLDVQFVQHLLEVSGSVLCLQNCPDFEISLKIEDGHEVDRRPTKKGAFSFSNLLSGKYVLEISKEDWCWENTKLSVNVASKDVTSVNFKQTGYQVTIWTSHNVKIGYKQKQDQRLSQLVLKRGTNTNCLRSAGVYDLKIESCHKFGKEDLIYDTSKPFVITLTAMKHRITGNVVSNVKVSDIKVTVTPPDGNSFAIQTTFVKGKDPKRFLYQFQISAYPKQVIKVAPSSGTLLFYPESGEVMATDDCMENALTFEGHKGLFINGQINPPLESVTVTVKTVDDSRSPIVLQTSSDGKYNVGPLDSLKEYSVSAVKSGYVLKEVEGKYGNFNAFKLAEIKILAVNEDGRTLSGVLVSLTGGVEYRQNNVTAEDGQIIFSDLSPGKYFLRPMMKEYRFDPVSKMFDVNEGKLIEFTVRAIRTAYSCFGKTTSLTGEAEAGVSIEAVGDPNSACRELQEDGVSETDGLFRIRGLRPGCEYTLQLKDSSDVNRHIERLSPRTKIIKVKNEDLYNVKLIVFRHLQHMEVTGNIVTLPEYLPTLKVKLYKEENPDVAMNTINVGTSNFFQLPSLAIDDTVYVMRLEPSLSRSAYETHKSFMPEITFQANTSYRHLVIHFEPKTKVMEHDSLGQGTLLALPLALLAIFIAYNYSKILPFLSQFNIVANNYMNPSRSTDSSQISGIVGRRKLKVKKAI